MRSVSSSEVICNISMRWRNCGVSTSRWERLVVSLRDIPQIRLPLYRFVFSDLLRLVAAREDYNRSAFAVADSLPQKAQEYTKLLTITCETFRPGKVCALPSLQ